MPEPLENIQKLSKLQLAGGKNDFPLGDSSLSNVSSTDILTKLLRCGGKYGIKPASSIFSFIVNISRLKKKEPKPTKDPQVVVKQMNKNILSIIIVLVLNHLKYDLVHKDL